MKRDIKFSQKGHIIRDGGSIIWKMLKSAHFK